MPELFEVMEEQEALRITLKGEALEGEALTYEDLQKIHGAVNEYDGQRVVFDLKMAQVITLTMIAEILKLHWKMSSINKQLVVRCDPGPVLAKFRTTNTDRILKIETSSPARREQL